MTCCPQVIDGGLHLFWDTKKTRKKFVNEILVTPKHYNFGGKRKCAGCEDCGKKFDERTFTNFCGRCENSVCEDCGKKFHNEMITKNDGGTIVVCNTCIYELDHLIQGKIHPADTVFNHYGHSKVHMLQRNRKNHEFLPNAGFLYVRVLRGHHFPQMDAWPFSCDAYATFSVNYGEENAGDKEMYTTNVQWNTVEPRWDSATVLAVKNSTGHLEMNIFDHDTFNDPDLLWNLTICLQDLTHGELVQYDCPIPGFEESNFTFQLKYLVDPVADMTSKFNTVVYYPEIQAEFDLNDFVDTLSDFIFFIQFFVVRPISSLFSIIFWESYTASIIGVIIVHTMLEAPNLIFFWIQIGILYAILDKKFNYSTDHEARKSERDYQGDDDLAKMDVMTRKKKTKSQISGAYWVNTLICMAGSDETLNWATILLDSISDGIRGVCDMLNYSDIAQTRLIVRVLTLSSTVSLLLSKFSWYYIYYSVMMLAFVFYCPIVFKAFCVLSSAGTQISTQNYRLPSFVNVVTDQNDIEVCRKMFQVFVVNKEFNSRHDSKIIMNQ